MSGKDEKEPNSVQVLGHDGGDKEYVLDEKRSAVRSRSCDSFSSPSSFL